jgi:hypothetical protein
VERGAYPIAYRKGDSLKKRRALGLLTGLLLLGLMPGSTLAVVGSIDQSNVPAAPPPVTCI